MNDTIIDLMSEFFFFTWFLFLGTWLIGLVVSAYYVNCVRVEVYELRKSLGAEKAELGLAFKRRKAR